MKFDIDSFKKRYDQCKDKNRYQGVDKDIYRYYFKSSKNDLSKSQDELLSRNLFWSIVALDSSVSQFIHGISIEKSGLRPKSRVCAENLVFAEEFLSEDEYIVIQNIRELRNKAVYDALFRDDLDSSVIKGLMGQLEDIFIKFGVENDW
ncbi:hypothetical protein CMI42_04150 [Candidatus Pacearchaeota archaeon]|nr:hypothetical protein [Candidatus Pacearchaeota archaeon]|tara:strand:+ start:361 stop:807 length:447 start_codon:yes stop_codon:yes gene_type:complete